MNWFSLLKTLAQRQSQGISARQKDEDFVFEDEEKCKDDMIQMLQKYYNFTKSKTKIDHFGVNELPYKVNTQEYGGLLSYERDEFYGPIQNYYDEDPRARMHAFHLEFEIFIEGFENMPEEAACDFIEMLKNPKRDVYNLKEGYTMYCGPSDDIFGLEGMNGRSIEVYANDSGYGKTKEGIQYDGFIARVTHNVYLQNTNSFRRNNVDLKVRQKLLNDIYPKLLKTTKYFDYLGVKFL